MMSLYQYLMTDRQAESIAYCMALEMAGLWEGKGMGTITTTPTSLPERYFCIRVQI